MTPPTKGGGISFHALKGGHAGQIIKVEGRVGKRRIMVLIDSGNTHSFLNEATATELGCTLVDIAPLSVTVANGSKMYNNYKSVGFKWLMQGEEFSTDLRILELGGCDIILGVDWMRTVSPLTFDFNKLEVTLDLKGRKLTLKGSLEVGECKMIIGKKLQRLLLKGKGQISQMFSIQAMEKDEGEQEGPPVTDLFANVTFPTELQPLLIEFKELFVEPHALPPNRLFNHFIPLKPNANLLNVQAYHYPPYQKAEIEK